MFEDLLKLKTALDSAEKTFKKSTNDDPDAVLLEDTSEQNLAEMASKDNSWLASIKNVLQGAEYGETPRELLLPNHNNLVLSKVDDGFYSGFLKKEDPGAGNQGELLLQITKMTPEVIVQILKTKGFLPKETGDKTPEPEAPAEYMGLVEALANFKGELHIHLEKAHTDLAQALDDISTGASLGNLIKALDRADGIIEKLGE